MPPPLVSGHVVYLLRCQHGKYYVGRCLAVRLKSRVQEHRRGVGAAYTVNHPIVSLMMYRESPDPLDEDHFVLQCMREYGIDNVRGGSYSRSTLPKDQMDWIRTQLDHADGRCFNCGMSGHFARDCSMSKSYDDGTSSSSCSEEDGSPRGKITSGPCAGNCFRCGREGHWSKDCYARTHVDGRRL